MPTQAPQVKTVQELASMDAVSRQAYFNSLPADMRGQAMANWRSYQDAMNRSYMKNTIRKMAVCPQSSGGALSQNYSAGAQLPFTIPSAQNAFCEGILIRATLNVTFATGTSAVYAATAGAPYTLFDNIQLNYNGVQLRLRPYILREFYRMAGMMQRNWFDAPYVGTSISTLSSYLASSVPVSGSSQAVTFEFYIPFNALHPQDVKGLLPIMGGETQAQVNITCASNALGNDPVLNTWYAVSGSGHAITFNTSTVAVYAVYRDGTSYISPDLRAIDLTGLGTVQYQIDVPLTGLTGSVTYRQKVAIIAQHYYVILTLIDGQQANKFSTLSNLNVIEADKDSVGANVFWRYGTGTNLSVNEYFAQIRNSFGGGQGQDLSEGILPMVMAPTYMESDYSNLSGTMILDTSVSGWTDYHYGIQFNSLASTLSGVTPRVECHCIYVNPAGLVPA